LDEAMSFAADTKRDPKKCPKPDGAEVPRQVPQAGAPGGSVQVCGGGALAYVFVSPEADCKPATARLARGAETADVLLVREATGKRPGETSWLVVARTPFGDGRGFTLEPLADDGVRCQSYDVDLKP
jgi:hypothetical protein